MITLYQFATSPFTEKVRRALSYKAISYSVHEVDRAGAASGDYASISPTGKFPVIDHDGHIVRDSTDIILYLDQVFPDRPLTPSDPREAALAHVIEDWADESLYFYEITMRLAWEHNLEGALDEFSLTMPGLARNEVRQRILNGANALACAQGIGRKPREEIVAEVARHFQSLDAMLDGRIWLVGDHLSTADLAVMGQLSALLYAKEARQELENTIRVKDWISRVNEFAPTENTSSKSDTNSLFH